VTQIEPRWAESIRKFVSLFLSKEVKTPLSFFFRAISAIVLLAAIALFSLEPGYKLKMLEGVGGILLLLILIVTAFAWFRPKNLVYGETGHRAEAKLSFGTEKQSLSEPGMLALPSETNPLAPSGEEK
jgi:hypothetical protein